MKIKFDNFLNNINQYIKVNNPSFIIGIAGGSGSGKTYIAKNIAEKISGIILSMDDYIKDKREYKNENWDLPQAWKFELIKKHLIELKNKNKIKKPVYDFSTGYIKTYEDVKPSSIIILEGNFALSKEFVDLLDLKIFIDIDEKTRLNRRLKRDIIERGRTKEKILKNWNQFVQPMYLKYIEPQKKKADLIISG